MVRQTLQHRSVLALTLVACSLFLEGCGGKEDPADKPGAAASAIPVSCEQLLADFRADKTAAETKYQGKVLEVQGKVGRHVQVDAGGKKKIVLIVKGTTSADDPGEVWCESSAKGRDKILTLLPEQAVKIKGKCAGYSAPILNLEECELLEAGPDPSLPVTAAQLTKEYATSEEAADKKFNKRFVLVEGVIADLQGEGDNRKILLEGFDEKAEEPPRVEVSIFGSGNFGSLKKGQTVKLKGQCTGKFRHLVLVEKGRLVK